MCHLRAVEGPNMIEGHLGMAPEEKSSPDGAQVLWRREFRWANTCGAHGMPTPEELEYFGYVYYERHGQQVQEPRYRSSVLMVREV